MIWLPEGLTLVRKFQSADNLHRLGIYRRSDGLFGYRGEIWKTEEDGQFHWAPAEQSGIYETQAEAERAALTELTWFRLEKSN